VDDPVRAALTSIWRDKIVGHELHGLHRRRITTAVPGPRFRHGGAPGLAAQNSSNGLGAAVAVGMTSVSGAGVASGVGSGSTGIGAA
jgi:hypothetical protein